MSIVLDRTHGGMMPKERNNRETALILAGGTIFAF